jgi:pyruvate-formate lyase
MMCDTNEVLRTIRCLRTRFFGGQALDLHFDRAVFARESDRAKIRDLIKTYFRLGGLEVQVNGVSAQQLREAQKAPSRHRDILVRKAGFTTRFVDLGTAEQDDIVKRFAHGK